MMYITIGVIIFLLIFAAIFYFFSLAIYEFEHIFLYLIAGILLFFVGVSVYFAYANPGIAGIDVPEKKSATQSVKTIRDDVTGIEWPQ